MSSRLARRLALALATLVLSLAAVELAWRAVLASGTATGKRMRAPGLYADPFADDLFWRLRHYWDRLPYDPPANLHPLLGWRKAVIGPDLTHRREVDLAERRPVLLYGDSFAQGMAGVAPFETILNGDPEFAERHFFLNFGVGGYGVDQIFLLFERSVDRFADPFVVFSLMTHDLDRSVLAVRDALKPRFDVVDGELALRRVPIEIEGQAEWLRTQRPWVTSFLWQRWLQTPAGRRRGEEAKRQRKQVVNGAILDAALRELEERDLDYVFLVFHARRALDKGPGWRSQWLSTFIEERQVRTIWSLDVLRPALAEHDIDALFDKKNVHPTSLANQLIAEAIAAELARSEDSGR